MKLKCAHIVTIVLAAMFIVACANIGSPDGGAYDETPPVVVRTSPQFLATNVKTQKIVLEFDENIRIDNAVEKVVVSPPQLEAPEISASGHKITVELIDTVRSNTTYTIDFADAIEDNNEGNPMGDYAFTFSTGDSIDTMQVSGYVLDASNLEPIKGIMVGLYEYTETVPADEDTTFVSIPFERVSRTDSRGHFIIKGLARKRYRVFALQDQDQTYTFSQKGEMLAFTDQTFVPTSRPDLRPDTVWHDSIHYDSIVMRPYTHFFPDDITLLAFTEKPTDRFFTKAERPNLWKFTLYFTNEADQLPLLEGLNFDADNAFVVENNLTNDTILYWIRDSTVYNLDTLHVAMQYMGTDTLGNMSMQTDTLEIVAKVSREKLQKQREREYEEWVKQYRDQQKQERKRAKAESRKSKGKGDASVPDLMADADEPSDSIPPMPEDFLEYMIPSLSIDPVSNIDIVVSEPVAVLDTSLIHLYEHIDSTVCQRPYILRALADRHNTYRLYAEWEPGTTYDLAIDTGAIVSIYGKRCEGGTRQIRVRTEESFGYIRVNIAFGRDTLAVVQLLNSSDKVVKSVKPVGGVAEFFYVSPGTYYMRLFEDSNQNGEWDTGDYTERRQAEAVYYYPGSLNVREGWDLSQDWLVQRLPIYQQKPEKITKQKPDKEKTIKNRNAERNKNNKR